MHARHGAKDGPRTGRLAPGSRLQLNSGCSIIAPLFAAKKTLIKCPPFLFDEQKGEQDQ
jgi:hypothetical protein